MDKSTIDRKSFFIAVHIFAIQDNQVLLGCRQNTGWHDGFYEALGGHLEVGESLIEAAAREFNEEVNLKIDPNDLKLFHIAHYISAKPYLYMMFRVDRWQGILKNNEPEFMGDLAFFPIDNLPAKTTPNAKVALQDIDSQTVTYSYFEGNGTGN